MVCLLHHYHDTYYITVRHANSWYTAEEMPYEYYNEHNFIKEEIKLQASSVYRAHNTVPAMADVMYSLTTC